MGRDGADPADAMRAAAEWVVHEAGIARPVLVGYPVVFDWMFLHWYFVNYAGESPFGFSGALDMKTIYQQKARVTIDPAGRGDLPPGLRSARAHTHDALEQAEIFNRLFAWEGEGLEYSRAGDRVKTSVKVHIDHYRDHAGRDPPLAPTLRLARRWRYWQELDVTVPVGSAAADSTLPSFRRSATL